MQRRSIQFIPDNFYHVYNRGNNGQSVFLEKENYRFFHEKIKQYFNNKVELISHCLMPSHYHLIVYLPITIDFSNVMRSIMTSFVKSYNRWHRRTGHLFEDDYQAILIKGDEQLIHTCRYIHINPVVAGLASKPEDWAYSDYRTWIGESDEGISSVRVRNMFFRSPEEYRNFVEEFLRDSR